jgi:hypothetical protein
MIWFESIDADDAFIFYQHAAGSIASEILRRDDGDAG